MVWNFDSFLPLILRLKKHGHISFAKIAKYVTGARGYVTDSTGHVKVSVSFQLKRKYLK